MSFNLCLVTDIQADKQKVMPLSPPCSWNRLAKIQPLEPIENKVDRKMNRVIEQKISVVMSIQLYI